MEKVPPPPPFSISSFVSGARCKHVDTHLRSRGRHLKARFLLLSTKRTVTRFPTCVSKKRARKLGVRIYTHTHTVARNYEKNALLFLSSSCRVGECCQRFLFFFFFFFCDDDVSTTTTTTTKFASTWMGRKINFEFDVPKLRVLVRGHRWRHALGNNPNR